MHNETFGRLMISGPIYLSFAIFARAGGNNCEPQFYPYIPIILKDTILVLGWHKVLPAEETL